MQELAAVHLKTRWAWARQLQVSQSEKLLQWCSWVHAAAKNNIKRKAQTLTIVLVIGCGLWHYFEVDWHDMMADRENVERPNTAGMWLYLSPECLTYSKHLYKNEHTFFSCLIQHYVQCRSIMDIIVEKPLSHTQVKDMYVTLVILLKLRSMYPFEAEPVLQSQRQKLVFIGNAIVFQYVNFLLVHKGILAAHNHEKTFLVIV